MNRKAIVRFINPKMTGVRGVQMTLIFIIEGDAAWI
jgi:hypothetical protein